MDVSGQSSVEAAILVPVLFIIVAILVEPACVMYTKAIMNSTAAETVRAAATYTGQEALVDFAKRRLSAVPEVSIFHVGGEGDWDISISKGSNQVEVSIKGHVRPLPLLGVLMSAFSKSDGQGIVLETRVVEQIYPEWVEGGYGGWQSIWG